MKAFIKQNLPIIGLLVIISIPSIQPLFQNGFFLTDDGEWMIIRLSAFYQTFADGQFPVRFLGRLNNGYGYPVATFLYPGFMYLGSIIHLFKIGFIDTVKIIIGLSMVGSLIFSYFWLSKLFHKTASVVGAIIYLYLPYHLYDVYTRGSVGEIFALMFIPFILWMIEEKKKFLLSIGIFIFILSHNTLALLFMPVIIAYVFLRKTIKLKLAAIYILLGFLLSSFYVIPVIFELGYTNFSNTNISNPIGYFADFKLIGLISIILLLFSIFVLIKNNKVLKNKNTVVFFITVGILSLFLSSSFSIQFWQIIPSNFIQFPFRLLSYSLVSLAFLSAFAINIFDKKIQFILSAILLVTLFYSAFGYMSPKKYLVTDDNYYSTNEATTTVKDEYMPIWVKEKSLERFKQKAEISDGEGKLENISYDNKKITFDTNVKTNSKIQINTIYWPGWKAFVNEKNVPIDYNNPKGLMILAVPEGLSLVRVEFGETPLRLLGNSISVLSLITLIYMVYRTVKT